MPSASEIERTYDDLQSKVKESNPKDAIGASKVLFSALPCPVLAEMALGMTEGAIKYRRHNYRHIGVRASIYYDAALRHIMAWWEGEDIDPDSGLPHVVKAMTSLLVLRDAMIRGKMYDDRPVGTKGFIPTLNQKTKELMDRYSEHKPPYTHEDAENPDEYVF